MKKIGTKILRFFRKLIYLIGQGFVGVFRNSIMSTASILVLICCMLIVGTFGLVIKAVDDNLDKINGLNVIVAYINEKATDAEIARTKEEILAYDPTLVIEFVDKETGLQKLTEDMGDDIDLNMYLTGERLNPLPDTFEITFASAVGAEALNNHINNLEFITKTTHKIGLVEKFNTARVGLIAIAGILMAVLLLVALFVIMNTIRLGVFARRDEIAIMRYVGATNRFVITPFIIEGILIGLISSAAAFFIQYYLYSNIITDIVVSYGIGSVSPFMESALLVGASFLAIGLFAGIIASGISVKKYLKA